jgi:hypothetical protein
MPFPAGRGIGRTLARRLHEADDAIETERQIVVSVRGSGERQSGESRKRFDARLLPGPQTPTGAPLVQGRACEGSLAPMASDSRDLTGQCTVATQRIRDPDPVTRASIIGRSSWSPNRRATRTALTGVYRVGRLPASRRTLQPWRVRGAQNNSPGGMPLAGTGFVMCGEP